MMEENIFLSKDALHRWEKDNSVYYDFDNHILRVDKWYPVRELYGMERRLHLNNAISRMYNPAIMMIDRRTLRVVNDWTLIYKGVEQGIEITTLSEQTPILIYLSEGCTDESI